MKTVDGKKMMTNGQIANMKRLHPDGKLTKADAERFANAQHKRDRKAAKMRLTTQKA